MRAALDFHEAARMRIARTSHEQQADGRTQVKTIISCLLALFALSCIAAATEAFAGYIRSEKDGKKFTTGFADLRLVDARSQEILWTFEYKPQPGAGGSAAQRVADQVMERLLEDAR